MVYFASANKDIQTMKQEIQQTSMELIAEKGFAIYCDDRIAFIEDIKKMKDTPQVVRTEVMLAILCLQGKGQLDLNGDTHTIEADDLLICHPNIVIGKSMVSFDMEFRCIAMSPEYIRQLAVIADNSWDVLKFLEKSPVIHLCHKETETFCQYYDLILSRLTDEPKHHLKEATDALLLAFLYEFHDTMERFIQLKPPTYSSNERLFRSFLELLTSSYPKGRTVSGYADRLHITPKYLSAVCKETCGHTASDLINEYVMKDALYLLKKSDKSIKEIVNELDFPNLSFFGKYVKRHTGLSPKQYREQLSEKDKE